MTKAAKKTAQAKLLALIVRLANTVTPDAKGVVPFDGSPGRMAEVGYLAGRILTLARKVFRSGHGCSRSPAAAAN